MRRFSLRLLSVVLLVLVSGLFALRARSTARAAGPFAYVTNISGQVYVIDTSTNTIVTTITTGQGPNVNPGVAVAPGGGRVYVTGSDRSATVAVIDAATNTVVTLIPVGAYPIGVAVSPDGSRVYTANATGQSISVTDTATNTVVQTIVAGAGNSPVSVVVSPDSSRIYVATQFSGGRLQVYSTSTFALLGSIVVGGQPAQVVVTPDGSRVYEAEQGTGKIAVVSVAGAPIKLLDVPVPAFTVLGLALTPDGTRLYATGAGSNVFAIDTASNSVIATIPVGGLGSFGVSVTPDGSRVYVADFSTNTVAVISVATNTVIGTINGTTGAFAFGQFIQPGSPATVTLSAAPNPVFPGLPLTLTATVGCAFGTPTGTVTFTSNGATLATATLTNGVATATVPTSAAAGGFVVVASYSGSGSCLAATSTALSIGLQQLGPAIYTVAIPHTGCGSTTPSNIPLLALQNVSITAVPCPGSNFVGWTGGPCDKTTINPCSIPAGVPVTANFAP